MLTKSGIIVGLGETNDEVVETMRDLRANGVDVVTIGQYLQPSAKHATIDRWVHPDEFRWFREQGEALGFGSVFSGPLVRSSYRADEQRHASGHGCRRGRRTVTPPPTWTARARRSGGRLAGVNGAAASRVAAWRELCQGLGALTDHLRPDPRSCSDRLRRTWHRRGRGTVEPELREGDSLVAARHGRGRDASSSRLPGPRSLLGPETLRSEASSSVYVMFWIESVSAPVK